MCTTHYTRWYRGWRGNRLENPIRETPYGWQNPKTIKACVSPTSYNLYWAAGFLEGEGHFGSSQGSHHIRCGQVQKGPLEKLQNHFGGHIGFVSARRENQSDAWMWSISGSRARGVMMTLYTLMSVGKQKKHK